MDWKTRALAIVIGADLGWSGSFLWHYYRLPKCPPESPLIVTMLDDGGAHLRVESRVAKVGACR